MKLTKKIESEVWKVYDIWLKSYLNSNVKTYDSYLDDAYHFIGSTANEEFLNRKETTNFFKKTADQLPGKTELRNNKKTIEQFAELIFITHLFDAWFWNGEDWCYYGRFRFSNALRKNKEGWQFIYQHFSMPVTKAQHEKTIGFDKMNEENHELCETLQRKTVELESINRELEIERALEKVRAVVINMWKPEDLPNVCEAVFNELKTLDFPELRNAMVNIHNDDKRTFVSYNYSDDIGKSTTPLFYDIHPVIKKYIKTIRSADDAFSETVIIGKDLKSWKEFLEKRGEKEDKRIKNSGAIYYYFYSIGTGSIGISTFDAITDEKHELLKHFRNVFKLAYQRFMDISLAEAQVKEVKIEASLERVRSRSMAMRTSEELTEAGEILYHELSKLGIQNLSTGYTLFDETATMGWSYGVNLVDGSIRHKPVGMDHTTTKVMKAIAASWKMQEPLLVIKLNEKETIKYQTFIAEECIGFPVSKEKLLSISPEQLVVHTFNFKHGYLLIVGSVLLTVEQQEIVTRFARVFQQTYTRFLDLQKAEAQTREAKIEASLEKVRSVALSLQKSEEMLDIAKVLYEQLLELGFKDIRNAIIDIHNNETETFLDYDYSHDMSSSVTEFSFYGDPVIEKQIAKIESSNDAFFEIELKGKQLQELIETRLRNGEKEDPRLRQIDHLTYNLYSFGNGAIGISNFGILSDEQKVILKRFRNVFTFSYQRYTDLANAEAQAREAKIEASLEKVRSVALSMNESTDLLHIAKALYEQLLELGFSDIRNALIDLNNEDEKTFLDYDYSEKMGGTVTLMTYDDDPTLEEQLRVIANTTDGFSEMFLEGRQLQDLIEMRRRNGEADDPRLLKADSISYILYAFGNGAVGISNFGILTKDQKSILDRFRIVFTFAYQRFKDLQVKEEQSVALLAEKQRLEKTLLDLQTTQKQLIQSEKMASLGELTAGIAHEIQNPLNFVNNFSEVSNELFDEMEEEMQNGNFDEATKLLNDIKQNLEKINHHGKRADGIVKGMLQHSRKSTEEKEPTDINKLADEYLSLAYHGLRAKNKSFNATLETDFDESIGKVNVIPQDIGRVILNLITNAFYACTERSRSATNKRNVSEGRYKPTVSVSTRKVKKTIEISVKDNGNGIPKHLIEKIFQPFFTTKPTGQGTGLGLSMSYDIITKAHGGELKVESIDNKGTEFIIMLPL